MALRERLKEDFEKKHGVEAGLHVVLRQGLHRRRSRSCPAVNAEIEGDDLVYKNYYDIGVAVGTPQGLVVPVLRDADTLSFAEIEKGIGELGQQGARRQAHASPT